MSLAFKINAPAKTFRAIILLILITYWAEVIKRQLRDIVQAAWMPKDIDI